MGILANPDVAQVQKMQHLKIVNGVQTGLELFELDVNTPISMVEGLTDLKWFLAAVVSGQFSVNLDPDGEIAAADRPQQVEIGKPTGPRPLSEYEQENDEDASAPDLGL